MNLRSDFDMESSARPSKKRKGTPVQQLKTPSSTQITIAPSTSTQIVSMRNNTNGTQVIKAASRKQKQRMQKVSLMQLLMPSFSYSVQSYGHETYNGPEGGTSKTLSMKYIAWPDGDQDVRQMCFLPSLFNYQQRKNPNGAGAKTASFFTQPGEQMSVDDLMRKSLDINVFANMQGRDYPLRSLGLWSSALTAGNDSNELNQSFQLHHGYVEHTFNNVGETVITIELTECAPRQVLIGATFSPNATVDGVGASDPTISNDPISLAIRSNTYELQTQTLPTSTNFPDGSKLSEAGGQLPQNFYGVTTKNTYVTAGITSAVSNEQAANSDRRAAGSDTTIYTGTDHYPPCRPGICDPRFSLNSSQHLLTYNYKVTKPKSFKLNPGGKLTYRMDLGNFEFSRSEWNECLTNLNLSGTTSNTYVNTVNLIPMFTKFLIVRARGEMGFRSYTENAQQQTVGYAGGAYTHSQREYYRCRSTFSSRENYKFSRNNVTDGWEDTLGTDTLRVINDQTATETNPKQEV